MGHVVPLYESVRGASWFVGARRERAEGRALTADIGHQIPVDEGFPELVLKRGPTVGDRLFWLHEHPTDSRLWIAETEPPDPRRFAAFPERAEAKRSKTIEVCDEDLGWNLPEGETSPVEYGAKGRATVRFSGVGAALKAGESRRLVAFMPFDCAITRLITPGDDDWRPLIVQVWQRSGELPALSQGLALLGTLRFSESPFEPHVQGQTVEMDVVAMEGGATIPALAVEIESLDMGAGRELADETRRVIEGIAAVLPTNRGVSLWRDMGNGARSFVAGFADAEVERFPAIGLAHHIYNLATVRSCFPGLLTFVLEWCDAPPRKGPARPVSTSDIRAHRFTTTEAWARPWVHSMNTREARPVPMAPTTLDPGERVTLEASSPIDGDSVRIVLTTDAGEPNEVLVDEAAFGGQRHFFDDGTPIGCARTFSASLESELELEAARFTAPVKKADVLRLVIRNASGKRVTVHPVVIVRGKRQP